MKTIVEADTEGKPLRVFHRTDTGTVSWTHTLESRATCNACQNGTLPADVRNGTYRQSKGDSK